MAGIKNQNRKRKPKKYIQRHKRSMVLVSMIILMLVAVVSVNMLSLSDKQAKYDAQKADLQAQIDDEEGRADEIEGLKDYVGSDEYIESVAREKLGLAYKDETLFKASK